MDIKALCQLMAERRVAQPSELVGVSEFEIRNFEKRIGFKLPESYLQFLSTFGRSAGRLSTWMAVYFDDLGEIQENFFYLLKKNDLELPLAKNTLLISQLGSYFDYIHCDGADDPAVYRVEIQGENGAFCEKCALSFSEYLYLLITNNKEEFSRIQEIHVNQEDGDVFEQELNLVI